jgi:hypothetical protein
LVTDEVLAVAVHATATALKALADEAHPVDLEDALGV